MQIMAKEEIKNNVNLEGIADRDLPPTEQEIKSEEPLKRVKNNQGLQWKYISLIAVLLIVPILVTTLWLFMQKETGDAAGSQSIVSALELSEQSSGSAEIEDGQATVSAKITTTPAFGVQASVSPTTTPVTPVSTPATSISASVNNRLGFAPNKYGIHLFAGPDQIELGAELVNSNGGDWGWATVTYHINNRDTVWWNEIFAKCKEKHIIPILQLMNDGNIPTNEQIDQAADFLASLGWPTRIRVISAFNEVNADEYWGRTIDPEGYGRTLNHIIDSFKGRSSEFFILNGPFNASAASGPNYPQVCVHTDLGVDACYLSEDKFLERMNQAVPGIFSKLDGWASHCYPHPGYRGHPLDTRVSGEKDWEAGRNTMSSYKWELKILSNYGAGNLPVFITETGWPHSEGAITSNSWFGQGTVAEYYRIAFTQLWVPDNRVVAVTPFILKYDQYDNFAFIKADGSKFQQWDTIKALPKVAASPPVN